MKGFVQILDYGASNILSLERALERLKIPYKNIKNYNQLSKESTLIIPGVGNFKNASEVLLKQGFLKLKDVNKDQRPFVIGICLGMQLLFSEGTEGGKSSGLNLLKGIVKKTVDCNPTHLQISNTLVGWEEYELFKNIKMNEFSFLDNFKNNSFYHVHSFMCLPENKKNILATYPKEKNFIPTIVGSATEKVLGFQFHPEKSGEFGIQLLNKALNYSFN